MTHVLRHLLRGLLHGLGALFCCAYPIALIGVAFDVRPPFSLAWAGSALLFLEGTLLIVAAMLSFGWRRGLSAGLLVIVLSYLVEALGVTTGFPFGSYRYTPLLLPRLAGGVPLTVMFAWALIVFGSYSWISTVPRRTSLQRVLSGAVLATLLDLEIEPVATHVEHYWQWLAAGPAGFPNYYGVPLVNFAAWFIVALLLLLLVNALLTRNISSFVRAGQAHAPANERLPTLAPRLLFGSSLLMFGLVDLTHGYDIAALMGLLAALLLSVLSSFPHRPRFTVPPAHRVQQDEALQHNRDGVRKT